MSEDITCPKCNIDVTKTSENLSEHGYMCPSCMAILEYTDYPHHGSMKVQVIATTDYFHGVCPNCKSEESDEHGMMVLGEVIWIEEDGKVVLPLECQYCGYRDAVKIATHNHRRPTIRTEYP